ncbi:MAG: sensor domain-containing diguanylate cyclase, partial [Comamonadaceae bacterium]
MSAAAGGARGWAVLWLAALLVLLAARAQAAAPVLALDVQAVPQRLDPVVRVLEDPGGQLTVQAVREPGRQTLFQPVSGRTGANFGLSRSAFWLQATVQPPPGAPADWLLEVAYPPLDAIELYVGRAREPLVGGDKRPFASRAVAHRNHVFPLRLVPGEPVTLLLRVQSEGAVNVPLRLWTPQAMWRNDQVAYGVLSLYFGLLGGLLLYNLLLYATLREPAWGWYVAFVGSMAVAQATLDGVGAQFLWPQASEWNSLATPVSLAASALLGMQFARSFLDSRSRLPRLDRLLRGLAVGWAVAAVVAVGWWYWASSRLTLLLAPVSVGAMLLVGWQAGRSPV